MNAEDLDIAKVAAYLREHHVKPMRSPEGDGYLVVTSKETLRLMLRRVVRWRKKKFVICGWRLVRNRA